MCRANTRSWWSVGPGWRWRRIPVAILVTTVVVWGATVIAAEAEPVSAPRIVVDELRVISWKPPLYHGWPTLARRSNGELLLAFSGGREAHVCPFGRVELMRSKDEGQTWGWPQVIFDGPIDDRDAGVLETAQGTLLVTTFTSLAYEPILKKAEGLAAGQPGAWEPQLLKEWQAAHGRLSAGQRQTELGCYLLRSTDDGISWVRTRVPVNSPHGPIGLADGRLLYAGVDLWGPERKVGVCVSADDGLTWSWLADLPVRTGDQRANYHELHAVEAANGTLVVQLRNHNRANVGETLQTESTDGGKTWSEPHAIGVWGLPAHLLRLRDDRLLMSYGHRRPPFGNQIRVSRNHGQSWSEPAVISADGIGGDLGYPSTIERTDGGLVTVWYERMKDSPLAQLRQARWRWE